MTYPPIVRPPKRDVLAHRGGTAASRSATVFFRQNKKSYKTIVNLSTHAFTPPALIPPSEGQLGLTITELSDFSFVFQDPAFLNALALRGIGSPAQLQKVFVTPLPPGSFELKPANFFDRNPAADLRRAPFEIRR